MIMCFFRASDLLLSKFVLPGLFRRQRGSNAQFLPELHNTLGFLPLIYVLLVAEKDLVW